MKILNHYYRLRYAFTEGFCKVYRLECRAGYYDRLHWFFGNGPVNYIKIDRCLNKGDVMIEIKRLSSDAVYGYSTIYGTTDVMLFGIADDASVIEIFIAEDRLYTIPQLCTVVNAGRLNGEMEILRMEAEYGSSV